MVSGALMGLAYKGIPSSDDGGIPLSMGGACGHVFS